MATTERAGAERGKARGRNFQDARWEAKQREADLVASILQGKGAMPGFRRQLSEAEVRRLVAGVVLPLAGRKPPEPLLKAGEVGP